MTLLDKFTLYGLVIAVVISTILFLPNDNVTAEQSPKLYCQYGAGHGVAVYDYELIGNNQILTDADDVFSLLVCDDWENYNVKYK